MTEPAARPHCDLKPRSVPMLRPDLAPNRARLIRLLASKWVNGTLLHYWFLDGPEPQRQAVRNAFKEWKDLPIGLEFTEVTDRSEAEVRIGFDQADGSWSYVGRDVLGIAATELTMNFGWDLTDDYGHTTALHEIGHTLGMPHEHQNPFAGIVWDEPKVYSYFEGSPNFWSADQTTQNVLKKIDASEVEGSSWDPDSVMEYWFPAGLIKEPARFQGGLNPAGGLSGADKEWVKKFYPAMGQSLPVLQPFQSAPLSLAAGSQADFSIEPTESRSYQLATFGSADTVLVLFEKVGEELRFLAGDDDSGTDRNATISVKLFQGRNYVARIRLYWAGASGQTAVMYW
ncbi:hypothetical protein IV498_15830 [Paenarthrobacter sp. Z7-10]|uniref:M12 family metallopeptidase n=1 Tax=Paenarthrobacter sp. Z7-10 TaxID=2787635 RepID=UPI0022A8F04A|nr:M12 family metallopeptidase [Paenarthrobacter sp. Z7-10]MCZ2404608.1 hypothetical protein [Paenarthrobacter sp. Z7-10]